jgi:hypothetical protein
MARYFVLRNADIQGMSTGIEVGSLTDTMSMNSPSLAYTTELIENSKFLGNIVSIDIPTLYTSSFTSGGIPPREIAIRNVKFDATPSPAQTTIRMRYTADGARNLIQRDAVFVYNYNQLPGDDFRVYYAEQQPDFIVPQTIWSPYDNSYPMLTGAPVAGLTNQQLWATYGKAIAGAVAPCLTTRAAVGGLVCGMTGSPSGLGAGPPSAPTNLRIIR